MKFKKLSDGERIIKFRRIEIDNPVVWKPYLETYYRWRKYYD